MVILVEHNATFETISYTPGTSCCETVTTGKCRHVFADAGAAITHTAELPEETNPPATSFTIYCDGACPDNGKPTARSGVGAVVLNAMGTVVNTISKAGVAPHTNQRAEILAATTALASIPRDSIVTVFTDSQYVVNTMMSGWKRKANVDLWNSLDQAVARHAKVEFQWIRGHAGNPLQEQADRLAVAGVRN